MKYKKLVFLNVLCYVLNKEKIVSDGNPKEILSNRFLNGERYGFTPDFKGKKKENLYVLFDQENNYLFSKQILDP